MDRRKRGMRENLQTLGCNIGYTMLQPEFEKKKLNILNPNHQSLNKQDQGMDQAAKKKNCIRVKKTKKCLFYYGSGGGMVCGGCGKPQ